MDITSPPTNFVVVLYYSSVPGNVKVRKDTTRMQDILKARQIDYQIIDVAVGRNKEKMQSLSGRSILPQLMVNDIYKAGIDEVEEANEDNLVGKLLGLQ